MMTFTEDIPVMDPTSQPFTPITPPFSSAERRTHGHASSSASGEQQNEYLPLVERDRLFFRLPRSAPSRTGASSTARDTEALNLAKDTFSQAFTEVWAAIPEPDRKCMRDHWHEDVGWLRREGVLDPQRPNPLIHLVKAGWCSSFRVCHTLGHELTFPFSLAVDKSPRLSFVIACALAEVYTQANGVYGRLNLDLFITPMDEWHAQHRDASDSAYSKQENLLEGKFFRRLQAEMNRVLRKWGFAESTRRPPKDRQRLAGGQPRPRG